MNHDERRTFVSPSAAPRNAWKAAALKYAVPKLPGEWQVLSRQLILRPFGFIARGVSAQDHTLVAILEPLFMPLDYNQASWLVAVGCDVRGVFPYRNVKLGDAYAEKYMLELVDAVSRTVYPYVTENGSLEGYFELCRRRNNDYPNGLGEPNALYRQAATAIILRRPEDAREALDRLRQAIESDPSDDREWVRKLYGQAGVLRDRLTADPAAVRDELLSGMDEQKRRRKLPLTG